MICAPPIDLPALARFGLEERRRRGHLDLLRDLADRQLQIDAQARADLHLHVVDERDRKAASSLP